MTTKPPKTESAASVSLADEEGVKRIVTDTLFGLWATVNNLSRLRPSKRERYRVTVFDSAGTVRFEAQLPDTAVALPDSVELVPRETYHWKVEARTETAPSRNSSLNTPS